MTESLKSDQMLDVLADVVSAGEGLPTLNRNQTLDDGLEALEDGGKAWLNMVDGDIDVNEEALGISDSFELEQLASFELIVKCADEPSCRAAISDLVTKISHQIDLANDPDMIGGLAAVGCYARITRFQRDNLVTAGVPNTKGASVTVALTFISDQPF
ncbi:hypothetical protein [Cohaesibacter celericrescens]|uniref:hypothetical protein n=1 Tax=Cohaesibacter celericrescens TaxID=2067669 RepID=UPI00356ADDBD